MQLSFSMWHREVYSFPSLIMLIVVITIIMMIVITDWLYDGYLAKGGVVYAVPDNDDGVDLTMTLTMLQIAMLDDGDGSDDWWQWL